MLSASCRPFCSSLIVIIGIKHSSVVINPRSSANLSPFSKLEVHSTLIPVAIDPGVWLDCWVPIKFNQTDRDMTQVHSGYGLSQWEATLQCNVVSHWLSPCPEWSLWLLLSSVKSFEVWLKLINWVLLSHWLIDHWEKEYITMCFYLKSYWWWVNIGSGNRLAPVWCQDLTWTNFDQDLECHVSLGQNKLL